MIKFFLKFAFFLLIANLGYSQCNLSVDLGSCQVSFIGYGTNCIDITANVTGGTAPFSYQWTPDQGATATITDCPLAPKTYSVLVTDASGCTAIASVQAFVFDVRCGKNLDKTIVCHNGEPTCVSAGSLKNHLKHGDKVGPCEDPCTQPTLNGAKLAVFEEKNYSEEFSLEIYPQPANGIATIEISNAKAETVDMTILNYAGQSIDFQKINLIEGFNQIELNNKNFKKGNYILQLKGAKNEIQTKKISFN